MTTCELRADKYPQKNKDVFLLLTNSLKKGENRQAFLEQTLLFLRGLPAAFVSERQAELSSQLRGWLPLLLRKSKTEDEQSSLVLKEILVIIGQKQLSFALNEVFGLVLKPKGGYSYTLQQTCFEALAQISEILPDEVAQNLEFLNPFLVAAVKDKELLAKAPNVIAAALCCFPYIRFPNESGAGAVLAQNSFLKILADFTLFENRGVATQALMAISRFVIMNPSKDLIPVLFLFVDIMALAHTMTTELLLKTYNNVQFLFQSFNEYLETRTKDQIMSMVDQQKWVQLRQHMEGVVLVGLCHSETFIRREVLTMLKEFSSPRFRWLEEYPSVVEDSKANNNEPLAPFLADHVKLSASSVDDLAGFEDLDFNLVNILSCFSHKFRGVIKFAFLQLYPCVISLQELTDESARNFNFDDDWGKCFLHYFKFLCLAASADGTDDPANISSSLANRDRGQSDSRARAASLMSPAKLDRTNTAFDLINVQEAKAQRLDIEDYKSQQEVCAVLAEVFKIMHFDLSGKRNRAAAFRKLSMAMIRCIGQHLSQTLFFLLFDLLRMVGDDKKKTPKGKGELSNPIKGFCFHDQTIFLVAQVISRYDEKDSSKIMDPTNQILDSMDLLVKIWVDNTDSAKFDELSVGLKTSIAQIIGRYIWFRLSNQHDTDEGEIRKFFDFLTSSKFEVTSQRLPRETSASGESDRPSRSSTASLPTMEEKLALKEATLKAVTQLILCLPQSSGGMIRDALEYTQNEALYAATEAVGTSVQTAMTALLKKNPELLVREYILHAIPSTWEENSINLCGKHVSIFPLTAIVQCFRSEFPKWLDTAGVTAGGILVIAILHQTSYMQEARLLALQLAADLATQGYFDPGYPVRIISSPSLPMYIRATLQYSRHMAEEPDYLVHIPSILEELIHLMEYLTDMMRSNLISMMMPWFEQCSTLIHDNLQDDEEKRIVSAAILSYLFSLTKKCFLSAMMTQSIGALWNAIFNSKEKSSILVSQVVQVFGSMYIDSPESHENTGKMEDRDVIRVIFVYISRSVCGKELVDCMMQRFRQYILLFLPEGDTDQRTIPLEPTTFLRWEESIRCGEVTPGLRQNTAFSGSNVGVVQLSEEQGQEKSTSNEVAAFELAIDLMFESAEMFTVYMPDLLQSTYVLFHRTDSAQKMIRNISLAIGVQSEGPSPTANATNLSLNEVSTIQDDTTAQDSKALSDAIIERFHSLTPVLLRSWSDTCMHWIFGTHDKIIADQCLEVLKNLQCGSLNYVNSSNLPIKLALCLYHSLKQFKLDRVQALVDVFVLPPTDGKITEAGWRLGISCGFSLLCYGQVGLFLSGLTLLDHFLDLSEPPWFASAANSHFWSCQEQQDIDQDIVDVLSKGLTSEVTIDPTLQVFSKVCEKSFDVMDVSVSSTFILCLLGNLMITAYELENTSGQGYPSKNRVAQCHQVQSLIEKCKSVSNSSEAKSHLGALQTVFSSLLTFNDKSAAKETRANTENKPSINRSFTSLPSTTVSLQQLRALELDGRSQRLTALMNDFFGAVVHLFKGQHPHRRFPEGKAIVSPAEKPVVVDQKKALTIKQDQLFGGQLSAGIGRAMDKDPPPFQVPVIVYECVEYLKVNGLDVVGLFRVPGENHTIRDLKNKFETGEKRSLADVHSVAGVLKLYFRELADPLLPAATYADFVAAGDIRDRASRIEKIKGLVQALPAANKLTLAYLFDFFQRVKEKASVNKMDASNIGMVFAPGLLTLEDRTGKGVIEDKDGDGGMNMIKEMAACQKTLEVMINDYGEIFTEAYAFNLIEEEPTAAAPSVAIAIDGSGAEDVFRFILAMFHSQLSHGKSSWRKVLFRMMSTYLRLSPYNIQASQIKELAEMVVVSVCDVDHSMNKVAEEVAYLLMQKADFQQDEVKDVFNFLRPRTVHTKSRTLDHHHFLVGLGSESAACLEQCLLRLKLRTLPVIASLLCDNPVLTQFTPPTGFFTHTSHSTPQSTRNKSSLKSLDPQKTHEVLRQRQNTQLGSSQTIGTFGDYFRGSLLAKRTSEVLEEQIPFSEKEEVKQEVEEEAGREFEEKIGNKVQDQDIDKAHMPVLAEDSEEEEVKEEVEGEAVREIEEEIGNKVQDQEQQS